MNATVPRRLNFWLQSSVREQILVTAPKCREQRVKGAVECPIWRGSGGTIDRYTNSNFYYSQRTQYMNEHACIYNKKYFSIQ